MRSSPSPEQHYRASRVFRLSIGTYFMGGFVVSLVSLLVPRLKLLLGLSYAQASLVQLAFHSSYLLFALPITAWLVRIGYMRGSAVGLVVMAAGCLLFVGAARWHDYPAVLMALLTIAGGITFLQIAGGIVVVAAESGGRAVPRMTMLQGFNSLGTVLAPLIGASFLLGDRSVGGDERAWLYLVVPFVASCVVLLAVAAGFFRHRDLLAGLPPLRAVPLGRLAAVLGQRRLVFGATAMFAYVGAEVTIGTLLANYLALPAVIGAAPVVAGRLVSLYWAGAMIGRFAGVPLLARHRPARVLSFAAIGALALVAVAVAGQGMYAGAALIAVGLCNAIMYPVVFALSLPDDEAAHPYAAMVLCMAVVGGAVVPVMTGVLADVAGLARALVLPGACYLLILLFARSRDRAPVEVPA